MTDKADSRDNTQSALLMALIRSIASRDLEEASRQLDAVPELAKQVAAMGATRQDATLNYFKEIEHYVYAGDTALHIAAAAYAREIAEKLLSIGADVRTRNRRGAEPLHYAVDGMPGSHTWNPAAQKAIVACLLKAGADPNSADKSGVTPLHRAIRTRCAGAVRTLLANRADPHLKNGTGSTPFHLAVQNTGRGGSGSPASKEQQREIIVLLLTYGAQPTDTNTAGKTVMESVRAGWVRDLIQGT